MPRLYILIGLAAIFILASTVLEYHVRLSLATSTNDQIVIHLNDAWYSNLSIMSSFLREIGFAFIIALLITILVERSARQEQIQATKSMIAEISNHVLNAVLQIQTPDNIVRQVMGSVFSSPIVRHDLRLTMTLSQMPESHQEWRDKCVELKVNSSYELENVSGNHADCPVRLYIPAPSYPELAALATVENVSIGGEQFDARRILDGDKAIGNTDLEKRYEWRTNIPPRGRLRVAMNYKLVKEISDNELWTSLHASTSIEAAVDMRLENHIWGVDTLHSGILNALDAPQNGPYRVRRIVFRSEEAILPYQGVMLWWRPDREPERRGGVGCDSGAPIGSRAPV